MSNISKRATIGDQEHKPTTPDRYSVHDPKKEALITQNRKLRRPNSSGRHSQTYKPGFPPYLPKEIASEGPQVEEAERTIDSVLDAKMKEKGLYKEIDKTIMFLDSGIKNVLNKKEKDLEQAYQNVLKYIVKDLNGYKTKTEYMQTEEYKESERGYLRNQVAVFERELHGLLSVARKFEQDNKELRQKVLELTQDLKAEKELAMTIGRKNKIHRELAHSFYAENKAMHLSFQKDGTINPARNKSQNVSRIGDKLLVTELNDANMRTHTNTSQRSEEVSPLPVSHYKKLPVFGGKSKSFEELRGTIKEILERAVYPKLEVQSVTEDIMDSIREYITNGTRQEMEEKSLTKRPDSLNKLKAPERQHFKGLLNDRLREITMEQLPEKISVPHRPALTSREHRNQQADDAETYSKEKELSYIISNGLDPERGRVAKPEDSQKSPDKLLNSNHRNFSFSPAYTNHGSINEKPAVKKLNLDRINNVRGVDTRDSGITETTTMRTPSESRSTQKTAPPSRSGSNTERSTKKNNLKLWYLLKVPTAPK